MNFSIDNILVNESAPSVTLNEMSSDTNVERYSFLRESYAFVLKYTKEWNDANKVFYTNILEARDNQEIITESFSDFFSKAKEIIKKFIEFIKKIFNEFVVKINSIFKSEKYLIKNKNEFPKFNSDDEFEFDGYEFTNLYNHAIPKSDATGAFYKDGGADTLSIKGNAFTDMSIEDIRKYSTDNNYNDNGNAFESGAATSVKTDSIKKYVNDKYKQLEDILDDFYDWFRGDVIGKAPIASEDFAEELKKIFRNDDTDTSKITIDSTFVNEAYSRFDGHKKLIKSIEDTRKAIEKDYDKLRSALDKSVKYEKDGDGVFFKFNASSAYTYATDQIANFGTMSGSDKINVYDKDIGNKIDLYIKAKINQIQVMSSIHSMAFSAKLQAAKDCMAQDKKILYKALAKIKAHKAV